MTEDVPGTPAPFPFGLLALGFATVAAIAGIFTVMVESPTWFPIVVGGLPALHWFAVLMAVGFGAAGLVQERWRIASVAGIAIGVATLTPFFYAPLLLLAPAGN